MTLPALGTDMVAVSAVVPAGGKFFWQDPVFAAGQNPVTLFSTIPGTDRDGAVKGATIGGPHWQKVCP